MINLGDKVKDVVTGFTGIVIARTEWLVGCVRCVVQPPVDKDGKVPENQAFDEPQLELIKAKAVSLVVEPEPQKFSPKRTSGGPMPIPEYRPKITR